MEKKLQMYPAEVAQAMSKELNRIRVASGLTVADVAARAYATGSYVADILKGKKNASKDMYAAICKALNVNVDELTQKVEADMGLKEPTEAEKEHRTEEGKMAECTIENQGVTVKAQQEDLYRVFLFCEERMADNLKKGTVMTPEELYKLMQAMYALRDATLQLQTGEVVEPPAKDSNGSGYNRKTVYD